MVGVEGVPGAKGERGDADRDPEDHELAGILRDLFADDGHRFAVPLDTVADYVRMVAFASALPHMPAFEHEVLSGLIARETSHYLKNDPKLRAGRKEVDEFMVGQPR